MCGIHSIISKNKKKNKKFSVIKHRGPDSTNTFCDGNVFIGFHRLAIIDPHPVSNQPLVLDDYLLICNGEIYNYKKLIETFNFNVRTHSDCEVILHLYKMFGIEKCLKLLNAEFAFILYDTKINTVYAARDPYGVRPLFYNADNDSISLCSEVKGLPVDSYINVKPFQPGTFMEINTLTLNFSIEKYYHFPEYTISIAENVIYFNINKLLTEAVEKRLMADRPLGCLLSGGLDSSLVASIASKYIKNLHCFSIGLENSVDIIASKKVAKHLGITHYIIPFTIDEGFNAIEEVIKTLESYDITTIRASTPQYIMAKYIANNTDIKVILSGEGSDELFAGYRYFKDAPSAEALDKDSRRLLEELYLFDNLRTDRTTARWGLEVRVPFLDKDLVDFVLTLPPICRTHYDIEKYILRKSFTDNYLPDEILWRPKEAFSDAVSSKELNWYKEVQKRINSIITDEELNTEKNNYKHNAPLTKEALYYRRIFNKYYPEGDQLINHYWMPKWQQGEQTDPSATILNCYKKTNGEL